MSAAKFWSTPLKENYLCKIGNPGNGRMCKFFCVLLNVAYFIVIALRNGGVNSYLLDEVEEVKESDFMSFLSGRWNMLIGKNVNAITKIE